MLFDAAVARDIEVVGPDAPTNIPTQSAWRADVFDIALVHNVGHPVLIDVCYDTDSQHLPILLSINTQADLANQLPPRPGTDWERSR